MTVNMISQARFYFCTPRCSRTLPSVFHLAHCIQKSFSRHPRFNTARFQASLAQQEVREQPRNEVVGVEDPSIARCIIENLTRQERLRLQNALIDTEVSTQLNTNTPSCVRIGRDQAKRLLIVSTLPFIGFGFLDNFLMIVAAGYIEHSLGMLLTVSTMAAAGLGHIVADVAGIGLTHYVEFLVSRANIKRPVLSAEQLESAQARRVVNTGRLIGLVVGCLIGMFPLIFYENPKKKKTS